MALDRRHRNVNWDLPTSETTGFIESWNDVRNALLMDIRDELQQLNRLLHCANFTGMPATLKAIERALKPKPKPKAKTTTRRGAKTS